MQETLLQDHQFSRRVANPYRCPLCQETSLTHAYKCIYCNFKKAERALELEMKEVQIEVAAESAAEEAFD